MKLVKAKTLLSKKNSINVYRGCTHGCIYCDSRSKIYNKHLDFENIEVKENAAELLDIELRRKKEKVMITTGAMSDPYIPLENELNITRKCLEVIKKYDCGIAILTKSNLILKDLDLLKQINESSKAIVQMTMTTFDENLCKLIEPNVSTTKERFEVLKRMNEHKISTIVWICPILPFINDTKENIDGLLMYCKNSNVKGIITFGLGMTLRDYNRKYYYKMLDKHFAGIKNKYEENFGNYYGIGTNNTYRLNKYIEQFCNEQNMLFGEKAIFDYINEYPDKIEQLKLF